jgi:hypothetical protein
VTTTVSTNDQTRRKRSGPGHVDRREAARALFELHVSGRDRWQLGHRKRDGKAFFWVPSSRPTRPGEPKLYHGTDQNDCSCDDRQRRADSDREHACKHMLAVRLWYQAFKRGEIGVPGQGQLSQDDRRDLAEGARRVDEQATQADVDDWREWDRDLAREAGRAPGYARTAQDGRPVWLQPGDRWGDDIIPGDDVPAPGQGEHDA